MKPIHISLSPNAAADDVRLALRLLGSPWRWYRRTSIEKAEATIQEILGTPNVVLTSSGRNALKILLQAENIGAGDEVIIQAFTCIAVPAAIQWAGARPVYADINPSTFNIDLADVARKITPHTRAIILQHTFGVPADITAAQALATKHQLLLIEDCAHAFGATYQGKPVGMWGDAAIISFGRDKQLSSVFGGALVTATTQQAEKARALVAALPRPPLWWTIQQLLHPIAMNLIKPWYFRGVGKVVLVVLQKLHLLSKAVSAQEHHAQSPAHVAWGPSPALAHLLIHQLSKLATYRERRNSIAQRYQAAFKQSSQQAEKAQPHWLRFPLLVKLPGTVVAATRQAGIIIGDWYDQPIVPATDLKSVGYSLGQCPVAEEVAEHIINLPTYPLLTDEQVEHVITTITPYV